MQELENQKSGLSITGFILSLLGLLIPFLGALLLILGIIFSIVALSKKQGHRGLAIAGIIIGVIAIIVQIIVTVAILAVYFKPSPLISDNDSMESSSAFGWGGVSAPFFLVASQVLNSGCENSDCFILELKNQGTERLNIKSLTVTTDKASICRNNNAEAFEAGQQQIFKVNCPTDAFSKGDRVNADLKIEYTQGTSTLYSSSSGNLVGRAE